MNSAKDEVDARRIALEFERLRIDRQKASIEVRLKRRELKPAEKNRLAELLTNPLPLAIVGGFVTLMTTTIANHFSTSNSIQAEGAKARQALQTDLIKKFVDSPNPANVRSNLKFLVDVGLVPDYAVNIRSFLDKTPDSALPSSFIPNISTLQDVHTDDDAINLVIKLEGGFSDSSTPETAIKYGITLPILSKYLNTTASKNDLRDLTIETARDIYKKLYLSGAVSSFTSVRVKAAYLSLALSVGAERAVQFFQIAVSKLTKTHVDNDGILGPWTLSFINGADPDLLIETVNCEAAKDHVTNIHRLRAFSPLNLKGMCPELSSGSVVPITVPVQQ